MAQRKVGIIVFDDAEVLDVMGPYEVFSVAGRISEPSEFQVVLISDSEEKSVTLRHRLRILTDRNIYEDALSVAHLLLVKMETLSGWWLTD